MAPKHLSRLWAEAPDVLTVGDAAVLLGVGRNESYRIVHASGLAIRFGRSIRISKDAFRRWVESGAEETTPRHVR